MKIRCSPVRKNDLPGCVEIFARHPVLASRYGESIDLLQEAWSRLLGQTAFVSFVFEEENGTTFRKVGLGTRAFLSDDFVAEMKSAPFEWIGPELTRRIIHGRSPLLTDSEVREANAGDGLNLFVWDGTASAEDLGRPEVIHTLFVEFVDQHRGFLLKELIAQSSGVDMMEAQLNSGGFLLDAKGQYSNAVSKPLADFVAEPHFIGVSRELALRQYGSWMSSLFIHHPPRFNFRPSEQRLLVTALDGETDAQLAHELGISISAVKKSWSLIYQRVAAVDPALIPDPHSEAESSDRGRTKKQRLLAYLHEHMEEIRPLSRE